jgi:hypothetical protein
LTEIARQYGDGWRVPHDPPDALNRTDQPLKTMFQAVRLQRPQALALPRSFIFCTEKDPGNPRAALLAPIARAAQLAKASPAWGYYEIPTGHLPQETMPEALASMLNELAQPKVAKEAG